MAQSIANKTAIVTGAGSGIGLAFTRLLLSHNCNVLLADLTLRPEALALVDQYSHPQQSGTARALFHSTDVSSWPSLTSMFHAATTHFGEVSIVCPCAGIAEPHSSNFWYPPGSPESRDTEEGSRYALFDVNLSHPVRLAQMAISHFLATGASKENPKSIVHIASVAAQIATPMFPMYVASKHAVQAFVRCLADLEARNGVRVTAVDPGIVKTPMWTENPAINVALGEEDGWVTAEEVAQVMLACVRDEVVGARFGSGDGDAGGEMIEIKGGSCLEVTTGRVRDVPLYGNVGPFAAGGKGARATKAQVLEDQVLGRLQSGWGRF